METETSNGSNGHGVEQIFDGTYSLEDHGTLCVVALFFIQHLMKASRDMVFDEITRWGGVVDKHSLETALEAMRSRGLVAYALGRKPKSGDMMHMYRMTKTRWSSPPEVAQLSTLVPKLLDTPATQAVLAILNDQDEQDGQTGTPKTTTRQNLYREFFRIEFDCMTTDLWLGGTPNGPWMDTMVAKYPHGTDKFAPKEIKKGVEVTATHRWMRQPLTGQLVVPGDVVRAYLSSGLYQLEYGASSIGYLSCDEILISPVRPLIQHPLPIIVDRRGAGVSFFEGLEAGQPFTMSVTVPVAKDFYTPKGFAIWLSSYAPRPRYGLSPGRNSRQGKFEVVDVRFCGLITDQAVQIAGFESSPVVSDAEKAMFAKLRGLPDDIGTAPRK